MVILVGLILFLSIIGAGLYLYFNTVKLEREISGQKEKVVREQEDADAENE